MWGRLPIHHNTNISIQVLISVDACVSANVMTATVFINREARVFRASGELEGSSSGSDSGSGLSDFISFFW
jgi:hypothetical protein